MYQLIETSRRMSRNEIIKVFDGKWVFLIKPEGPLYAFFICLSVFSKITQQHCVKRRGKSY